MKHFYFTLGPVQSFVSQARRIRDFWAGSFLLSWLSAVAMRSVEAQGCESKILFPKQDKNLIAWLEGNEKGKVKIDGAPKQGSVPNRFVAKVPDEFKGEKIAIAVHNAWRELAEKVWENDLTDLSELQRTTSRDIWDRQIENFWEITWVITDGPDEKAQDQRKNWRNHTLPVEQGLLCSLMEGWVELSGEEKPGKATQFWEPLRKKLGRDLNEREQLCAIAFVKRRFAEVFHKVNLNMDGWTCYGWPVQDSRIPSIDDMAAVHWLERILRHTDNPLLEKIVNSAEKLRTTEDQPVKPYCETHLHPICCIRQAYENPNTLTGKVAHLNGGVFFEHALHNNRLYKATSTGDILKILGKLRETKILDNSKETFDKPSPYYAILLMDGDNMGQALSKGNPQEISKALLKFNKATADLVYEHNGFLIYAGGDDVLALLPVEDALNCAYQLHKAYDEIMEGVSKSTLSGAIQFAHVKTPLTLLLQNVHKLLDDVAKKRHGRDSLALRVWSHSGQKLEWAMPWKCASGNGKLVLQDLLESFQQDGEQFSNSFFYKIREFFREDNELDIEVKEALLVSAYRTSKKVTVQEAQEQVEKLISQCYCIQRKTKEKSVWHEMDQKRINPDGALLLRFLADKSLSVQEKQQ
jgi:CRISPR-associated protein Cmr2